MTEADSGFSYEVFASTRENEVRFLPLDDAGKQQFLRSQFEMQDSYYHEHYRGAAYQVIERHGVPVGRLYIDRQSDQILVIDIALLPLYRRAGIGSMLMNEILQEARDTRRSVRLHVEQFNPALAWYERLGFKAVEEVSVYLLMEWLPDGFGGVL